MARPVEIDREGAFDVAVQLFWRQGYNSTSLQQLLDGMGIGKSSFYAAFDSKEALFLDVLARYCDQSKKLLDNIRSRKKGLNAIQAFLEQTLIDIPDEERKRGCLAVNSTLELAGVDAELHKSASEILNKLQQEMQALLVEAKALGEVASNKSAKELAQLLIVLLQGLRVSSRRGMSRAEARKTVNNLLMLVQGG